MNIRTIRNEYSKIFIFKKLSNLFLFIKSFNKKKFFILDNKVFKIFNKYLVMKYFYIIYSELDKNIFIVYNVINNLLNLNFSRSDYVFSVGGGVSGDISGFISSIYLRGINFIYVPTTLLSQVDASIGGKTGINTIYAKNCIGTYYNPFSTFICVDFVFTLCLSDYLNGFSEIFKISFINNLSLFCYIKNNIHLLIDRKKITKSIIFKVVIASIKSKLNIVSMDYRDTNVRFKLNFGHTFSHSLENYFDYKYSHGRILFIGIYLALLFSYFNTALKKKYFILLNYVLNKFICIDILIKVSDVRKVFFSLCKDKKRILKNSICLVLISDINSIIIKNIVLKEINIFLFYFFNVLITSK